jgi:hypothetical protein
VLCLVVPDGARYLAGLLVTTYPLCCGLPPSLFSLGFGEAAPGTSMVGVVVGGDDDWRSEAAVCAFVVCTRHLDVPLGRSAPFV